MVLLELEFTSVVPTWMRRMVHALELPREAFCKYAGDRGAAGAAAVARRARPAS